MVKFQIHVRLGERRMSQAALARVTDIRANTISHMYNGYCERVSLEDLGKLCKALECDVCDILVYESNDKAKKNK
jgi:putative transcriptional regulator